jgi:putative acetyltransferase
MTSINIREERPGDEPAIYRVNELAFGEDTEPKLVDALRDAGDYTLSLVAEIRGDVVGHVLFSPLYSEMGRLLPGGIALGPLAVLPDWQRQGVGSALVREGLRLCTEAGHHYCILLGSSRYYPRFGFEPATPHGIWSQFDALNKDLQLIELAPLGLDGFTGLIRFAPAFDEFS